MRLATTDLHDSLLHAPAGPVRLLAPDQYQARAVAAYEDAELLLGAILPHARVAHVGASAVAGAWSRGGVDVCVVAPRDGFDEALGVLLEAGYVRDPGPADGEQLRRLRAPEAAPPLGLHVIVSGSRHETLIAARDALRRDASLLARYNALRIEAAPSGAVAYRAAQARFFDGLG